MLHAGSNAITNITRRNGLLLDEGQLRQLSWYVELLLEWNTRVNLVSRRDEENIWTAHILHSLSPLFHLVIPPGLRVLDLGTGGGLPGLPLAIARRDLRVVLLDSIAKKARALEDILGHMQLANASVRCARAEELARGGAGEFDVVISRAVAPLVDLVRWSRPLLKRGVPTHLGLRSDPARRIPLPVLLGMKGGDLAGELNEAKVKAGLKEALVLGLVLQDGPLPGLEDKKLVIAPL